MKPSVGRIVHYYPKAHPSTPTLRSDVVGPLAAMVVHVHEQPEAEAVGRVNLSVYSRLGEQWPQVGVVFSETPAPGCWSWPPRV